MQEELNKKLLEAAKRGDIEAFEKLRSEGADVHCRNKAGSTALLIAAGCGHIPMLEYLLKNKLAAMTERTNAGFSALLVAASCGQIPMLDYLLKNKLSEISERTDNGNSALLVAAGSGQIPVLEYLLRNKLSTMSERNNKGLSPLLMAAASGSIPMLEYLLENKLATMTERSNKVNSALLIAAAYGHIPMLEYLLKKKLAEISERNNSGKSALLMAAASGHIPMLQYLLDNKLAAMSERDNFGNSPLLVAAAFGHIPMLEYLLKKKLAEILERNSSGESALLVAATNGHIPILQYLLDNKLAAMSERDSFGNSPLLLAASNGHVPMVEYFLKKKLAEISERNHQGESPLLLAAHNGCTQMVKYLVENKLADISERNNYGNSALLLAAVKGHIWTVRFLLKKGAFVDMLTNDGLTTCKFIILYPEASKETLGVILAAETLLSDTQKLFKMGAPIRTSDWIIRNLNGALNGRQISDGNTALHLAVLHKNNGLVKQLLDHGADSHLANNDKRTPMQLGLSSEVPYIQHCFNLIKLEELSQAPVATMEIDTEEETSKDLKEIKESKESKEAKETKESKEGKEAKETKESRDSKEAKETQEAQKSLEQNMVPTEDLDKLIETIFKGIRELSESEPGERNGLFYKLGTILCKPHSPSFRPLLAYQTLNAISPLPAFEQYKNAQYKAYELVMGGHVIISKAKNPLEDELEVLPNTGLGLPNDDMHRYLRLKTILKHLHAANYQDKEGKVLSKLVAEFALGPAESMAGIPGLTGVNGESQFILVDLLQKARIKSEEHEKRLKEAFENEQKLMREKQEIILKNESLTAEIESLRFQLASKSQLASVKPQPMEMSDESAEGSKKRKASASEDSSEPSAKRMRLKGSSDVSNGSPPMLLHYENSKGEDTISSNGFTNMQLAPTKLS